MGFSFSGVPWCSGGHPGNDYPGREEVSETMPTAEKAKTIDDLTEKLASSSVAIVTDYRGLKVSDMSALRKQLRQAGVTYEVTKNTLARAAAERAGIRELEPLLTGPTAIAFGTGDVAEPAKLLIDYERESKILKIRGGLLKDRVLTVDEVRTLATLPPREVLVGRLMGQMNAPIASFVGVLNATLSSLLYVLKAREEQLSKAAAS